MNTKVGRLVYLPLIPLVIAEISSTFELTMVYAALPTLYQHFENPVSVGWVLIGSQLVTAVAAALGGRLGDLYGRKRVAIIALAICSIGSLISGLSSDLRGVVIGASIQGISGAIQGLMLGLCRESLPKDRVPLGFGIIIASTALSAGLAIAIGGAIIDYFSWHAIFFTSAMMGVIGMLALLFLVPARKYPAAPTESIGMFTGILFAPAIGGLLFAIGKARDWGWNSASVHMIIVSSLALLAFWFWHQWKQKNPLIQVRFFAIPQFSIALICQIAIAMGTMNITQIMSLLLQQPTWTIVGFGLTATMSGLILLPAKVVGLVASPLSGRLVGHHGARTAGIIGALILTAGWGGMIFFHDSITFVITAVVLIGIGNATIYVAIPGLVIDVIPSERTSEALGLSHVLRALGMAVGAQMVTLILSSSIVRNGAETSSKFASDQAYFLVFIYVTATSLLCLIGFLVSPRNLPAAIARRTTL